MQRPVLCCKCGSCEHEIPMPINGKVRGVDLCVADIVAALNAARIITDGSCCGHGKIAGTVILADGRWLLIARSRDHFERIAAALADGGYPLGGEPGANAEHEDAPMLEGGRE